MKSQMVAAVVVTALGMPATGHAGMTKAEYNAEKARLEAEFDAASSRCRHFGGNALDICLAEARGSLSVDSAELDERRFHSFRSRYKLRVARAEAEFEIAAEECDERASAARDACLAEAKAALASEKATARGRRKPPQVARRVSWPPRHPAGDPLRQ